MGDEGRERKKGSMRMPRTMKSDTQVKSFEEWGGGLER